MRKETTYLILLGLLLGPATSVKAQEDELKDEDLQALLDEKKSPSTEVSEVVEEKPSEQVSSETVEVTPPDSSTVEKTETVEASPATEEAASTEPVEPVVSEKPVDPDSSITETIETLEPLDSGKDEGLETAKAGGDINSSTAPPADDLDGLKKDIGEDEEFSPAEEVTPVETVKKEESIPAISEKSQKEPAVFDVGREERDLLAVARNIQGQISDSEWSEVATAAKVSSYTVVKNDWLFKISKRLFGSGFYYPKIWSLNSYITNPHFIEPGMVLSFTTGNGSNAPEVKLGTFSEDELNSTPGSLGTGVATDLANFGEDSKPKWLDEKNQLANQGVYFQYASEETMDDLTKVGEQALNREYENYDPPRSQFDVIMPNNYDKNGFDKNSKIFYSVKEGFYLSTFVSTNIVQDFGSISDGPDENIYFVKKDHAYVKFDDSINALPGDKFSVYTSSGKIKQANSDREGFKYSIVAQIKLIRKIKDKWEIEFIEVSGTPQRGDRITAYTPKIERITKTYNSRLVEAAIIGTYEPLQTILGFGDVIYLDRGRADGVEMGNVFEVYGFKDRLTKKNITDRPTYKMGEVTVITLTDNFATALVTNSIRDFYAGDIAMTKTKESHLREQKAREARARGDKELIDGKALEELDVELNLENLNDDLLKQADKIQLTEDELAELERQEREKSVIKDSERDLKSLERLENEIEQAESILNDAKLDEDKLLENENLNELEKKRGNLDQDSLEEIEENLGKRYIDEDLNSKDNPFGLTEFDIEEVDELLNTEKKQ